MEIHFNEFGVERNVKETKLRLFPKFKYSMNHQLSSYLTQLQQCHEPSDFLQFRQIVLDLLQEYLHGADYEKLLRKCMHDGHVRHDGVKRITIVDGTFAFAAGLNGGWSIKILDYGAYERALNYIAKCLQVLALRGFLRNTMGVLTVQDGDVIIHFHIVFLEPQSTFYSAYHSNFDRIECYAKAAGPRGDLFVFRYEEPVALGSEASYLSLSRSLYEDSSFEIECKVAAEVISLPMHVGILSRGSQRLCQISVGQGGRAHNYWSKTWHYPLIVILTAGTIDGALTRLEECLENRGVKIVGFDELKQNVYHAAEEVREK